MHLPEVFPAFLRRELEYYREGRSDPHLRDIVNRYRGQYFVTLREGVWELGLDPDDPDWAHIGWDWVRPADADAWRRLKKKRELAA